MKWQGIYEFVAVAETQSFSAAAKRLNISTAQVSRQISALEDRLQVKLFYRTTRKVALTEEAELYYQHCRLLLDGLDTAEEAITSLRGTPQGKIKLAAPVTFGERKIQPLINDFVRRYDQLEVETELRNHPADMVEEGFDLAIRIGRLEDSTLIAKKIGMRHSYVCASPRYIEKYGKPSTPADLKHHNCLVGTREHWLFTEKNKEKRIKVNGNIRCNSGIALLDAALKDIGIVQLSDFYVDDCLRKGKLVTLLDNFRESAEGIWAVYPQNRYLSPKLKLLIDHLTKHLSL
jgi:DNA-binding transcriptional LysR family regulator